MTENKPISKELSDGVPYEEVYCGINTLFAGSETIIGEVKPMTWDKAELVRFFKRLGSVPPDYNRRKASLRVLLAAQTMAKNAGVPINEVYRKLNLLTSSDERGICLDNPKCPQCPLTNICKYASRSITIKDLPMNERPRERLLAKSPEDLNDSELLAIILGGGNKEENAVDLARRLIATYRTLAALENASVNELQKIKGIGKTKIARLKAAFALGKRSQDEPLELGASIKGSRQLFEHFRNKLGNIKKEVFIVLLVDTKHRVIREEQISIGSLNETLVHPREVFIRAIAESAYAVIFVHNHPSGVPNPSIDDHKLTKRLVETGKVIGIKVLDHLIVGNDSYYSFAENHTLEESK